MIGKTVAQYRILEPLGSGAMGVVYKAIDETLRREVAIKVLTAERATPSVLSRFQVEASAGARLNHPAIAAVYELFRHDGELIMVMEFVRGETLEQICSRTGPIPVDDAVYLTDQVLWALEHAHAAGVVHGDIKPANIMVTGDSAIKITDFGTARVVADEEPGAAGHLMGTPAYMAPEQLLGESVDGRADLYAVGVMFYRLLTGTLPFVAATTFAMARKQLSEVPASLGADHDGLPGWCDLIATRALAKGVGDRFQTAQQFRDALRTSAGWTTAAGPRPMLFRRSAPNAPHSVAPPASPGTTAVLAVASRRGSDASTTEIAVLGVMAPVVIAMVLYATTIRDGTSIDPPSAPRIETIEPSLPLPVAPEMIPGPFPTETDQESAAPKTPEAPHPVPAAPETPVSFEARLLESDGDHSELRDCAVRLANGAIDIRDPKHHGVLRDVPYDHILSISYSHGRDPLRPSNRGPVPVAHVGSGIFRFMYGGRYWLTLRARDAGRPWIVLQLAGNKEAASAIAAIERRTGLSAETLMSESPAEVSDSHLGVTIRDDLRSDRGNR